jgi:hypothetical protein
MLQPQKKGLTKGKLFIIFLILIIVIAIAVAAASNGGGGGTQRKGKTYACTINAEVGLSRIIVINQNAQPIEVITLTPMDLPFTFNFVEGDTLSINVTAISGYSFNAWWRDDKTFPSSNPLVIKGTRTFTITAKFIQTIIGG